MATRFVKAKVDKYIQLYSKLVKNENITYYGVVEIEIIDGGTGGVSVFSLPPNITISPSQTGGIRATATCTIADGKINTMTITNKGSGYTNPPALTIQSIVGGGGAARANNDPPIRTAVFKAYLTIKKRGLFEWDFENAIEINEIGVFQVADRVILNANTTDVYSMRLLDISTHSVINTTDKSGNTNQPSFNQGKVIHMGNAIRTIPNDIKVEIQPQTINKIVISIDEGVSGNKGINRDIEFYISLKIVEKEPSVIKYGSLNNINTTQL